MAPTLSIGISRSQIMRASQLITRSTSAALEPPARHATRWAPDSFERKALRPSPHRGPPRQDGVPPFLPPGLLGEPVVEHGAREADVPTYSMAGQAASPHGLIDPARLDVEIPGGLLWAKESILHQGGRWLCCRCWSLHALYRPQRLEPASEFGATSLCHLAPSVCPKRPAGTPRRSLRAPNAALQRNR